MALSAHCSLPPQRRNNHLVGFGRFDSQPDTRTIPGMAQVNGGRTLQGFTGFTSMVVDLR